MEDATLDGAHGNLQFLGNLIIVEPIEKHGEWLPEIVLQPVNRRLDVVDVDQRGHRVMVVILTGIQEVLVLGLVDDGILEPLPLVVVNEDVPHDGVEPSFDVGPFLEIVLVAKGLDERFLHQIIGVFPIPGEAHGEPGQEFLMTGQQVVEFNRRHLVERCVSKIEQNFELTKGLFNFFHPTMNKRTSWRENIGLCSALSAIHQTIKD